MAEPTEPLGTTPGATRKEPWIPVGHPDFKWTSGADVQATWHRYTGWTPPSANRTQFFDTKPATGRAG